MRQSDQGLGFMLRDVTRLLRRNFNRRAQALGLSATQWQALAHLARNEGVNQATLAESLEMQPISLARIIDRLQEMGLAVRRPDPADRRAFRLYLAPEAESLIDQMWTLAAETYADAMVGLPEAEQHALIRTLAAIKQNLLDAEAVAQADAEGEAADRSAVRHA